MVLTEMSKNTQSDWHYKRILIEHDILTTALDCFFFCLAASNRFGCFFIVVIKKLIALNLGRSQD